MNLRRGMRLGCGCLCVVLAGFSLWVGLQRFISWQPLTPAGHLSLTRVSADGRFQVRAYTSGLGIAEDEYMEIWARQLAGSDQALRRIYQDGPPVTIALAPSDVLVMTDRQSGVVYRYPLDQLPRAPLARTASITWAWAPLMLAGLVLLVVGLGTAFSSPRVRPHVKDDLLADW